MNAKIEFTEDVRVLSIDLGRTATKACIDRKNVVFVPANVAQLPIEKVHRGGFESQASDPLSDLWLEYQGCGYAVGSLAADFGASLGVGESKVENALIKTFACAGHFGLSGDIAVAIGLPFHSQDQFALEKEQLVSLLKAPHRFAYRGTNLDINVRDVWVIPEGFGSLIWCNANRRGRAANYEELSAAVVDIGHQTTDFLMVDRLRFARGASKSEPHGMAAFYEKLAAQIPGADSQSMALIQAVHRPDGERFFRPRGEARPTDLDEILPSLRKSFARELLDLSISWLPERTTDVVVCGGGGDFFRSELLPLFRSAGLRVRFAKPSREANALGQFVYAKSELSRLDPVQNLAPTTAQMRELPYGT